MEYPLEPRSIDYDEVIDYCNILIQKVKKYNPTEIIGVARSGMPFATFIAQKMNLDLGYYNPTYELFVTCKPLDGARLLFVDENFVTGNTQSKIRNLMATKQEASYLISCIMLDMFCPDRDCIYGKELDFWALDIACFFKPYLIEEKGNKYRDNHSI